MTLLENLNSDLLIAESELLVLKDIIGGNNSFVKPGEISFVLYQTTKAKIDCINKQIEKLKELDYDQKRSQYVDRRDGSYTC
jgi:hypothetical protein